MRCGQLRTVRVVVDPAQGVDEAPDACAQEGNHGGAHGPQHCSLVGVFAAAALHHVESKQRHHEEWNGLQCGEHATHPVPVTRQTDEVEVVASAQNARDQREGDDHVHPLVDHFTVHTGRLDQHKGQQGRHDQLPRAFHPQVHHEPPVHLVAHQVAGVDEAEQEQQREAPQTKQQHQGDGGLATLQHGHADVEEEAQCHHHNADFGRQGLLQELAPHGGQQVVTCHLGQRGIGHQQVTEDGQGSGGQEDPEQHLGEQRAVKLGFALFGHHEIGGAHESEQQPHDQQVGVNHAGDVEGNGREHQVADHVLQAERQTENDLAGEQS